MEKKREINKLVLQKTQLFGFIISCNSLKIYANSLTYQKNTMIKSYK